MMLEADIPGVIYRLDDGMFVRTDRSDTGVYSDGDEVEEALYKTIFNAEDRSLYSPELLSAIVDWPSRYHFSPVRANLLRPFEANLAGAKVLELGAGCGALTRYLAELGCHVVAVESSLRRAKILRARTAEFDDVVVVCDSIDRMHFSRTFDVVLGVGVLEYSRIFCENELTFLQKARSALNLDGILILALENQLGLKYFCGAKEDHLDKAFAGVNDQYSSRGVITFGRAELSELLRNAGLGNQEWYVPCPDYKLPNTILRGDYNELSPALNAGVLMAESAAADFQRAANPVFSMEMCLNLLHRNGLALDLANSFLVVARKGNDSTPVSGETRCLAWHYSTHRRRDFVTEVRFLAGSGQMLVERKRLYPESQNSDDLPLKCLPQSEKYLLGRSWWMELVSILNHPGWTVPQVAGWARVWISALLRELTLKEPTITNRIPGRFLDATPFNMINTPSGVAIFFDHEWELEREIELGYLLCRGIHHALTKVTSIARPSPGTPTNIAKLIELVLGQVGFKFSDSDFERYALFESQIQNWVLGPSNVIEPELVLTSLRTCLTQSVTPDELKEQHSETESRLAREVDALMLRVQLANELKEREVLRVQLAKSGLAKEKARLNAKLSRVTAKLSQTRAEKAAICSSTTWQLTYPLRLVAQRIPPRMQGGLRYVSLLLLSLISRRGK